MAKNISIKVEGLEETLKRIRKVEESVRLKALRSAGKKAAKPMAEAMKGEIQDFKGDEFIVYRGGKPYATITPGQLRESIGVMFFKSKNKDRVITIVGPRVKGKKWGDPNVGGWYAHFLNYGYLLNGSYTGENKGFADRAKAKAYARSASEFKMNLIQELNKYIAKMKAR
jgi:HK97 gp10 family phage protein